MASDGHRQDAGNNKTVSELVAVKVIRSEGMGLKAHDELMHEAEIMASFNHPNILAIRGIVFNRKSFLIFF